MLDIRKILTVGGTFAAMIGIGFVMQTTSQKPAQIAAPLVGKAVVIESTAPVQQLQLTNIVNTSAAPALPLDIAGISTLPEIKITTKTLDGTILSNETGASALACEIELGVTSTTAAMVDLILTAPCFPNEPLTVHHNGMMFSETTGEDGVMRLRVPALAETAVYIVSFSNGEGAVASTKVPSLEFYDRVVVQWRGETGIQLHAREFGANYGDEGHIWSGSTGDISSAATGKSGFLTRHGSVALPASLLAEVYTFPSGTTNSSGEIELSVEAEVTAINCGREIEAQTFQVSPNNQIKVRDLSLFVPECDAVGDFLVLNDLLESLTIAQN